MADVQTILTQNLAVVEQRITDACRRAGRQRSEVTLVAITKYVDVETARTLVQLGVKDLGESRPQELWKKAAAIPEAYWHLVGHLQRNKVEQTLPVARLIHSVDSLRLLEALEAAAQKQDRPVFALLEFNLSGEENKHGFALDDLPLLQNALNSLQKVHVWGLMTMAALTASPEQARPTFAKLRELRNQLLKECRPPHSVDLLSMGMTNDFKVAIEEGATLVRIGSALFRGLEGVPT